MPRLSLRLTSQLTHVSAHSPSRVREKKATGLPFRLRVAANATSAASVSTSKGALSAIAVITASSILSS